MHQIANTKEFVQGDCSHFCICRMTTLHVAGYRKSFTTSREQCVFCKALLLLKFGASYMQIYYTWVQPRCETGLDPYKRIHLYFFNLKMWRVMSIMHVCKKPIYGYSSLNFPYDCFTIYGVSAARQTHRHIKTHKPPIHIDMYIDMSHV